MSTNGVNVEDADMAECEEEKVVTMMDVLQEQQEFEDDANAVLGASDDKNCTYSKGYIKRQAIYACLTCCVEAKDDPTKRAGVCLACSLNCHENHELIELYTKRNFRCDCGNPKFNGRPCQFVPEKPDLNEENSYNQNFSGLYCTCHRPYPDPEATFEDEMIQCIICEDWLHAGHLEAAVPTSDYAEMVCKACIDKNEFLHSYSDIAVDSELEDVDILNNSNELNGMLEKVNGSVDFSNPNDTPKGTDVEMSGTDIAIDNAGDTTDEIKTDKTVVEQDESGGKTDKTENSDEPKADTTDTTNESAATDSKIESSDSVVDSSNKDGNTDKPITDNESAGAISSNENNMETEDQNNDNSIIENIEKLENELGNVEPKENIKENNEQAHTTVFSDDKNEETDKEKQTSADEIISTTNEKNEETDLKEKQISADETISTTDEKTETEQSDSITANVAKGNVDSEKSDSITANEAEGNADSDSKVESNEENNKENDVQSNDNSKSDKMEIPDSDMKEPVENNTSEVITSELNESKAKTENCVKDTKRKLSTEENEDVSSKKPKLDDNGCVRPKGVKKRFKGAAFWPSDFRQRLCTCTECINMYKDLAVLYLTDAEDTVTAYEALGREKTDGTATSQYEKGLEALTSLGRIQQINALTEYNKMRDKLLDYLKSFKERKEIVKEEDIKAFFAGMKPKRESDGVYFCR